ncbi:MAG TPA: M23 family metallopeptidase [Vicinamibacterales bacterium]|nr:M23 family metallopeptidase [Vicinamibacterales bacterium]
MRKFGVVVVLLLVVALVAFVVAGSRPGPSIQIAKPEKLVGASTPVEIVVGTPAADPSAVTIVFEQNGTRTTIPHLDPKTVGVRDTGAAAGQTAVVGVVSRETVPMLASGAGRIIVSATRPVLFGLRTVASEVMRGVQVRLEKPRLEVVSTHHYINVGGSEAIVYKVQPNDVASGVTVGDFEYPGFPATGAAGEGVAIQDPSLRIAFFALRYDQPESTPMRLYARDEAGNTTSAEFEHRVFPKAFKSSRIAIEDKFLEKVIPAILATTTEINPQGSLIDKFVAVNSELRKKNADTIAAQAAKTSAAMLWKGVVFHPFTNNAVESAFADKRTYVYNGKDVDHQTHLGFDLASTANATIVAANRGKVVYAAPLGIYGNCVIIDHGMGVQSLYGHLSSLAVQAGADVEKEQPIGKSGQTGMAGGDHLHFTMLVNGQMVNPVEWWDSHWIADRILRKLK